MSDNKVILDKVNKGSGLFEKIEVVYEKEIKSHTGDKVLGWVRVLKHHTGDIYNKKQDYTQYEPQMKDKEWERGGITEFIPLQRADTLNKAKSRFTVAVRGMFEAHERRNMGVNQRGVGTHNTAVDDRKNSSIDIDRRFTTKNVIKLGTPGYALWKKHPNRYDIQGWDTKRSKKAKKRVAKARVSSVSKGK